MSKKLSKHTQAKLDKLLVNTGDMALKRRARRIIEELNPQTGDKILDAGCGDGYYLHLLSNLGLKLDLTGADFDPSALASAKKNLKLENLPAGRQEIKLTDQGDLMKKLPFADSTFDKIVLSEVAEHLPDDVKGLKELRRVLKRGGILVLTVPNQNYPFLWDPVNWILEHFFGTHVKEGFLAGIWNQHIRLYKPNEIKKVVEKAGFKVKLIESLTWWCLPFNHNLVNLVARGIYGGNIKEGTKKALSKYEVIPKRPFYIDFSFRLVNSIDSINNLFKPKSQGVSVLISARK